MKEKRETYDRLKAEIDAVIDGEPFPIARYASAVCLLSQSFPYFFWTGFYLVDPKNTNELVIGPYQGSLGCLRIPFGKGVCGTAAQSRQTIIVPDVHAFAGHIACDSRSRSEIVVPVLTDGGDLAAVLDVDSDQLNSFDTTDKTGLEAICATLLKDII